MKDKKKKSIKKKVVKKVVKKQPKKVVKKKPKKEYVSKHGKREKKIKIRYGRIFICLVILAGIIYFCFNYVKIPIRNIFISGNTTLNDQEIIDLSGLRDYPSVLGFTNYQIEKNLEKNIYIMDAEVEKKFRKIYIKVKENYGLFYNTSIKKTIMYNELQSDIDNVPILINYVTEKVYDLFIDKMKLINRNILNRISEIKYDPNSVDEERFLFTMSDGNYIYITLEKIEAVNNYVDIIKTFDNKKGILYLDSGEYFEVFGN